MRLDDHLRITDADNDPLTWNWSYSIDGGAETAFSSALLMDSPSPTEPVGSGPYVNGSKIVSIRSRAMPPNTMAPGTPRKLAAVPIWAWPR